MKYCPKCNFSFDDSNDKCDFDGADLVDDRPPLTTHRPLLTAHRPLLTARFLRLVKSPLFLIGLGLAGVFSSLLMIVHYGARQPNSVAESKAPRDSVASQAPPAQSPARSVTQANSNEVSIPTRRSYSSPLGRGRVRVPTRRDSRPELALQRQPKDKSLQRDSKENPTRKESKLTAALKTTWNIIKKPFKF